MKILADGCGRELSIFKSSYYLQCVFYNDSLPNLQWYTIVLLPAATELTSLNEGAPLYGAAVAMASAALTFCIGGIVFTLANMKTRLVKLTQPFFTLLVLFGGIMLGITCFLLLGDNSPTNCALRPYFFNLSFTLTFSPLLIKAWRVHMIFNVDVMSKNKQISNRTLLLYSSLFLFADAIILVTALYAFGRGTNPETVTELSRVNGAYQEVTRCAYVNNTALLYAEVAYKALLIAAACLLSFKVLVDWWLGD
jgi:hypothetical protein